MQQTMMHHPPDAYVNRPSIKKTTQTECKNVSYVLHYPCKNRVSFLKQTFNKRDNR